MNGKNNCGLQTIGCCVKDCKYHEINDFCTAANIKVENAAATRKGETFCSTFVNRASN